MFICKQNCVFFFVVLLDTPGARCAGKRTRFDASVFITNSEHEKKWVLCECVCVSSLRVFSHSCTTTTKCTSTQANTDRVNTEKKRRTKSENWFVTHARRRKREVQSFDISFLYNCSHRAACVRFFFLLHRQSRFSPFFSTHTQRYGERTKKKKKNAVHGKKSLLLFLRSTVFSIWIETKKKTFSDSIVAKYKYNREKSADHCVKSACIQCVNVELS